MNSLKRFEKNVFNSWHMKIVFIFIIINFETTLLNAQCSWKQPIDFRGQLFKYTIVIYFLCFCSQRLGSGAFGTILNTINGGSNWKSQSSGINSNLHSVFFTSTSKGWAVADSGIIITTDNGGISWSKQNSGIIDRLNSVYFANPLQGWAVGAKGTIISTNDGEKIGQFKNGQVLMS